MKVRKAIRRIVALGTGLTMLGATVFGATAADLGEYPNQYIKDGKFDGLMVVGAKAKTEDVLGIVDIATSLQFASKTEKTISGTSTTSLSGDAYQIGTSADMLEIGEALGSVKATLTGDELGALASTRLRTSKGSTDADQYLKFRTATTGLRPVFEKNKDNIVGDYLKADNNKYMFSYELQFPEGLKSATYTTTSGTTKTDAGTAYMNDIHDEDFYMLGDTFNVVEAKIVKDGALTLTLMGGALTDTLKEGESKTYEIDGKTYEVNVLIIADSANNQNDAAAKVKFMINGEVTKSLNDGDTDTLEDGTVIGIKSILANEGAEEGGDDIVSFYLGANKVELEDNNYTLTANYSGVKVDESTIEDAKVALQASWTSQEAKITSIVYDLKADSKVSGDLYVESGDSLRNMLDEPEGMLSRVWDVHYLGLSEPESTILEFVPSADEGYYMDFTNQEGIPYSVPLVDVSDDKNFAWKLGTDDEKVVFVESSTCAAFANAPIDLDDYFIVSKVADEDKAFTHVLTFDNVDTSDGILSFSDIGDGSTKEVTYATTITDNSCASATTDLIVGGESYAVTVCTSDADVDTAYRICVDLDGDGDIDEVDQVELTLYGGPILRFEDTWVWNFTQTANTVDDDQINRSGTLNQSQNINMALKVLAKFTDNNVDQVFSFYLENATTGTTKQVDLQYTANSTIFLARESDKGSDMKKGMTRYGILVEEYEPSGTNDADTLTITIPAEQVFAQVFVTGGEATASTGTSGSTVAEYTRIQVGKSVLDTEITSVAADNLIVVGGPCANTVAATILGISSAMPACYENFPVSEGQGIIKMVDNGDKVATLVAGFSADDTRKAAQILANYEDYYDDLMGKDEVVVSGTRILAAQVVAEEPEEEEEPEEPEEPAEE